MRCIVVLFFSCVVVLGGIICPMGGITEQTGPPFKVVCPDGVTQCFRVFTEFTYAGEQRKNWEFGCDSRNRCGIKNVVEACLNITETQKQYFVEGDMGLVLATLCCSATDTALYPYPYGVPGVQ